MLPNQHIPTAENDIICAVNREERLRSIEMKKIAFFDTKPYDKESFDRLNNGRYEIRYFETRLTAAALPGWTCTKRKANGSTRTAQT